MVRKVFEGQCDSKGIMLAGKGGVLGGWVGGCVGGCKLMLWSLLEREHKLQNMANLI